MLKIKDDVNLKELEKFGLKAKYDEDTGKVIAYEKKIIKEKYLGLFVTIKETKTRIRIFKYSKNQQWIINKYNDYFDIDTLYDLIKADLVEKVDEK